MALEINLYPPVSMRHNVSLIAEAAQVYEHVHSACVTSLHPYFIN